MRICTCPAALDTTQTMTRVLKDHVWAGSGQRPSLPVPTSGHKGGEQGAALQCSVALAPAKVWGSCANVGSPA